MYCPQCGSESSGGQPYCRSCGANLKVIGKAVTLSEAIARSDRGPLPKIKEMIKGTKVEAMSEEISTALDHMKNEIANSSGHAPSHKPWWLQLEESKTPERRREEHIVKGTISFFSGIGIMIFLYYFAAALVLKLPPEWVARLPFEVPPMIHVLWLVGVIPTLTGIGRVLAGLYIGGANAKEIKAPAEPHQPIASVPEQQRLPVSVTEHTTNILDRNIPRRRTNEIVKE